ncbi:DMT family transporter [Candidatus Bathyarchaeota archaeon]|nr:DMT family transporter [Candidatus Bathyarchaeota archaeon]
MTHHWGYMAAISSALLFGIGATLNKIVLADVHPTVVAGLIYLFAGLALSIVRLSPLRNRVMAVLATPTKTEARISRKDFGILALVVLSGSTIAPFLFLNGLNQTTAINASLLQNTESLFTVLMAFLFLKEKAYRKDWVGILFLFVGVLFLTTNGEFYLLTLTQSFFGNVLIVIACVFWGIDNNLSRFLSKKEDLILITTLKCLAGGTALLLLSLALGLPLQIPLFAFPYLLSAGAFSIGFSILLFLLGLREIGAMKTSVIFSTSSLFGAAFAFAMLREDFSFIQLLAGFVMSLGVYVIYKK